MKQTIILGSIPNICWIGVMTSVCCGSILQGLTPAEGQTWTHHGEGYGHTCTLTAEDGCRFAPPHTGHMLNSPPPTPNPPPHGVLRGAIPQGAFRTWRNQYRSVYDVLKKFLYWTMNNSTHRNSTHCLYASRIWPCFKRLAVSRKNEISNS